jgi:hypothetical protein
MSLVWGVRKKELQRLHRMANEPPTVGLWIAFYDRLRRLVAALLATPILLLAYFPCNYTTRDCAMKNDAARESGAWSSGPSRDAARSDVNVAP